jgi:hypothetical protein
MGSATTARARQIEVSITRKSIIIIIAYVYGWFRVFRSFLIAYGVCSHFSLVPRFQISLLPSLSVKASGGLDKMSQALQATPSSTRILSLTTRHEWKFEHTPLACPQVLVYSTMVFASPFEEFPFQAVSFRRLRQDKLFVPKTCLTLLTPFLVR